MILRSTHSGDAAEGTLSRFERPLRVVHRPSRLVPQLQQPGGLLPKFWLASPWRQIQDHVTGRCDCRIGSARAGHLDLEHRHGTRKRCHPRTVEQMSTHGPEGPAACPQTSGPSAHDCNSAARRETWRSSILPSTPNFAAATWSASMLATSHTVIASTREIASCSARRSDRFSSRSPSRQEPR